MLCEAWVNQKEAKTRGTRGKNVTHLTKADMEGNILLYEKQVNK
jgi:hypothetical protein